MRRRDQRLSEAAIEGRRREAAASRLSDECTDLRSLRLRFEDVLASGRVPCLPYSKPVVVETARAHFEIHCMEPRCDGYHDLTRVVLTALHQGRTTFSGSSQCTGTVGDIACDRTLAYACEATYAEPR